MRDIRVIILFLCAFVIPLLAQNINAHEFEKGDGIFRDASYILTMHSAIYYHWNPPSDSTSVPVPMNQQLIIEMGPDGMETARTVQDSIDTFGFFYGPSFMSGLTATQRRAIVATALQYSNAEYNFTSGYKNPTATPPTFRCDGLLEYCYEIALGDSWEPGNNGGIINNDEYWSLSPDAQYFHLLNRTDGVDPVIVVKDSDGNIILEGDNITDNIIVEVTDGNSGSGITRLEVWRGSPIDGGTEVESLRDNSNYNVNHTYSLILPGGEIFIRVFDQAGNEALFNVNVEQKIDMVFVIDTTGSMYDDIAAAKASAIDIVNQIDSETDDYRIAVVDFRDFPVDPYGGPGDYPYNVDVSFSTDKTAIVSAINGLSLGWGNDWPESHYSALMHCFQKDSLGGWRDNVKKVAIVMTDAPPHDPEPFTGYVAQDVIDAAIALDPVIIYPIVIGSSSVTESYMETLAEGTAGKVFNAANASEVVEAIMEAIEITFDSPTAEANGPYCGDVGSSITFDASGSYDPDGNIISFEWDFDDDGVYDISSTSLTVDYTYSSEYTGLVKLRVTDNDGLRAMDIASVEVTEPDVPGDLDGDGDVDRDDISIIRTHLNQPASICQECDIDGDGTITGLDARKLVTMCTCARCLCP